MTELGTAMEAPRWALDFIRRHLALVVGLSLIPAVERFTGQIWERGPALGLAGEVATTAARLVLTALLSAGPLYWAVLLAVKNLTVIPFTMIWLVAAVRQVLLRLEPVTRP
jgi:hypothetical protein